MHRPEHRSSSQPPHRTPTSDRPAKVDLLRELLRARASALFAEGRYAEFEDWLCSRHPLWHVSPTALFLVAMSRTYQLDKRPDLPALQAVSEIQQFLQKSREGWDELLDGGDLRDTDATLLRTSIDLLEAWVILLTGESDAAVDRVRHRWKAVSKSLLWEGDQSPDLLHCVALYLAFFAAKLRSQELAAETLQLLNEHYPMWESDDEFVGIFDRKDVASFFEERWSSISL